MANENTLTCRNCENEISDDFEYCTLCGSIFIEDVKCINHPEAEADGVCLICESAFCIECGSFVNNKFFCAEHNDYEVYQSMARVFGSSDNLEIGCLKDIFEQEGLHPFIYTMKASPISLGGPDYSLFRPSGDYDGHIINEIKIMVPLSEVLMAEEIILSHRKEDGVVE